MAVPFAGGAAGLPRPDLIAVATNVAAGSGATVWRFAHYRSTVEHDQDPWQTSFWYQPRPNASHDGRWAMFTSNWEKTLGIDPQGDPGGQYRQDVFLVKGR